MLELKAVEFLKELLGSYSPSGFEQEATRVFKDYCSKFAIEEFTDKMGNVAFKVGSGSKKVMISAHIDELGMMIQNVTDQGMLNIINLGGIDKKVLPGSIVKISKIGHPGEYVTGIIGKKPIHVEYDDNSKNELIPIEDLLVDIGAESKEEAMKLVEIGSRVVFEANFIEHLGKNRFASKGLDDKIGVFIVAEVLRNVVNYEDFKELFDEYTFYGVANTQEEVGLRGAMVTSKRVNPDISIDIDVTFATDEGRGIKPESYGDIELGKGPVIMNGPDKSWDLRCKMIGVAEINEIPYQLAASYAGGTNTSAIQEGAFDCETMLVSIPQRNMHTQVEVCDYRDVEGAINLISKTLLEITK